MSVAPSSWHRSSTKASTKKVQRLGQHHSKCHPTSCIFFYSKESSEHPDKFPKPGQVQAQGRRVVEHWGNLIVLFVHCICQIVTKVSWRIQPFSGNQRFSSTHSWSRSRPRRSSASSLLIPSRSERVAWYDVAGVKKKAFARWNLMKTWWSQRLPTLVNAMSMQWRYNAILIIWFCSAFAPGSCRENIEARGSNGSKVFREGWFENHQWRALHDAKAGNVKSFVKTHQWLQEPSTFVLAKDNIAPTEPPHVANTVSTWPPNQTLNISKIT